MRVPFLSRLKANLMLKRTSVYTHFFKGKCT